VQVRVQLKSPTCANASVVNTAITIGRAESTNCNQAFCTYRCTWAAVTHRLALKPQPTSYLPTCTCWAGARTTYEHY